MDHEPIFRLGLQCSLEGDRSCFRACDLEWRVRREGVVLALGEFHKSVQYLQEEQ